MTHDRGGAGDDLSARRAALRVLLSAGAGELLFDIAFDRELSRRPLSHKDRALALHIAAGTLKLRRRLDYLIDQFLDTRHKPLPVPIQQILRMGVFQLTELSRVPKFAAVNTSVDLAKQWGHAGTARLVNAILRKVSGHEGEWKWPSRKSDPVQHLGTVFSYPNWLIRHWILEHGEEQTETLCRAGNRPSGVTVRLTHDTEWSKHHSTELGRQSGSVVEGRWFSEYRFLPESPAVGSLKGIASGEMTVQNEASAIATYLLDIQPGDMVLDIGAAPGGKSTHMARMTGETGRVIALDLNSRRMQRLRDNIARTGFSQVVPVRADGRALPVTGIEKVLIDAPCTGLGLIHRHPDLRWGKSMEDIERLSKIQFDLISSALNSIKPGGRVVYSTCTTTPQENQGVIARILQERTDVTSVDPRPLLPKGVPATAHWVSIEPDPPQIDGAFACCLKKTAWK